MVVVGLLVITGGGGEGVGGAGGLAGGGGGGGVTTGFRAFGSSGVLHKMKPSFHGMNINSNSEN